MAQLVGNDAVKEHVDKEVLWWYVQCVEQGGREHAEKLRHEAKKRFLENVNSG